MVLEPFMPTLEDDNRHVRVHGAHRRVLQGRSRHHLIDAFRASPWVESALSDLCSHQVVNGISPEELP